MNENYILINEDEDNEKPVQNVNRKKIKFSRRKNKFLYILLFFILSIMLVCFMSIMYLVIKIFTRGISIDISKYFEVMNPLYRNETYTSTLDNNDFINNTINNNTINNNTINNNTIWNEDMNESEEFVFKNFVYLTPGVFEGPITIDRNLDDGTKLNIYKMTFPLNENTSLYYDELKKYNKQNDTILMNDKYFCELNSKLPPEGQKDYSVSCPHNYQIAINDTFYGRFAYDTENCKYYSNGTKVPRNKLYRIRDSGYRLNETMKKFCDGKKECILKPHDYFFYRKYRLLNNYLYINYQCIKKEQYNKPKISIVMFGNDVKVNSLYENSISEMYQYSTIHGYNFYHDEKRYVYDRLPHFMKLNTLIKYMSKCIEEDLCDWIVWIDSDVIITNPNIELEAFLPEDDNIHFIVSDDHNGLNSGFFFLRVNSWSYNFLLRAASYSYYNKDLLLKFSDQSSINNVLIEFNEEDHYTIVPKSWFNSYYDDHRPGDFVIHLAGVPNKNEFSKEIRLKIMNNETYYDSKSSYDMRIEVLEYYNLPRELQHHISIEGKKLDQNHN